MNRYALIVLTANIPKNIIFLVSENSMTSSVSYHLLLVLLCYPPITSVSLNTRGNQFILTLIAGDINTYTLRSNVKHILCHLHSNLI